MDSDIIMSDSDLQSHCSTEIDLLDRLTEQIDKLGSSLDDVSPLMTQSFTEETSLTKERSIYCSLENTDFIKETDLMSRKAEDTNLYKCEGSQDLSLISNGEILKVNSFDDEDRLQENFQADVFYSDVFDRSRGGSIICSDYNFDNPNDYILSNFDFLKPALGHHRSLSDVSQCSDDTFVTVSEYSTWTDFTDITTENLAGQNDITTESLASQNAERQASHDLTIDVQSNQILDFETSSHILDSVDLTPVLPGSINSLEVIDVDGTFRHLDFKLDLERQKSQNVSDEEDDYEIMSINFRQALDRLQYPDNERTEFILDYGGHDPQSLILLNYDEEGDDEDDSMIINTDVEDKQEVFFKDLMLVDLDDDRFNTDFPPPVMVVEDVSDWGEEEDMLRIDEVQVMKVESMPGELRVKWVYEEEVIEVEDVALKIQARKYDELAAKCQRIKEEYSQHTESYDTIASKYDKLADKYNTIAETYIKPSDKSDEISSLCAKIDHLMLIESNIDKKLRLIRMGVGELQTLDYVRRRAGVKTSNLNLMSFNKHLNPYFGLVMQFLV